MTEREQVQAQQRRTPQAASARRSPQHLYADPEISARNGASVSELSERRDIIVMTDEAHRSQYDILALNMRNALPNAAFLGFTGTPLMAGEEETREVFGDYVAIYNFAQSVEDGTTVPLYYENRIPELQLTNTNLNEGNASTSSTRRSSNEEQEQRLERRICAGIPPDYQR